MAVAKQVFPLSSSSRHRRGWNRLVVIPSTIPLTIVKTSGIKSTSSSIVNPASLKLCTSTSRFRSTTSPHNYSPSPPNPSSSTVDSSELSHFNALASSWWDPHGSSRLLHLMNPLRIQFIKRCLALSSPSPPSPPSPSSTASLQQQQQEASPQESNTPTYSYLDIGCGGGILTESLARLANTSLAIGIDPSSQCISIAKTHRDQDPYFVLQHQGKLQYFNCTIEDFSTLSITNNNNNDNNPDLNPAATTTTTTTSSSTSSSSTSPTHQFDILTLMEVLEHVPYPSSFLTSCLPHIKPGGWLILSTISRTWTSWFTTKLVAEHLLGIVPRGTHDWDKYVNEGELREWFGRQAGWGGEIGHTHGRKGILTMGCVYVPGFGWREVKGGEKVGNYFFAVRRDL